MNLDRAIKQGVSPPADFNFSSIAFVPKGDFEDDKFEVVRAFEDTRPLSMKNIDNKNITLANVLALEPSYKQIINKSQNGFVPGRNIVNNPIDIDAAARIYSCKFEGAEECMKLLAKNYPIIGAFDFGAAFPSISQQWIWLVLKHRQKSH